MTPTGLAPPPHDADLRDPVDLELDGSGGSVMPHASRRSLPQRFAGPPLWISLAAHLLALVGILLYVRFGPDPAPIFEPGTPIEYVDLITTSELPVLEEQPLPDESIPEEVPPQDEPAEPAPAPTTAPPTAAPGQVITSEGGETEVPADAPEGGSVNDRLRPGFSDPRLYADPELARLREPGVSDAERYRQHFNARVRALNDSIYGQSGPNTDWTVKDGDGNRWGISEEGVHLGPVTVPRALVPIPPPSGTNADLEAAREQQRQREEIQRQEADRERRQAQEEANARARERR